MGRKINQKESSLVSFQQILDKATDTQGMMFKHWSWSQPKPGWLHKINGCVCRPLTAKKPQLWKLIHSVIQLPNYMTSPVCCRVWLHLQGWLFKAVPVLVGVRGPVHLSIWSLLLPCKGHPLLFGVSLTKQALWGLNTDIREIVARHKWPAVLS